MHKTFAYHAPASEAGQTRAMVNRMRDRLQAHKAQRRPFAPDLGLALTTGALLGWVVAGAGWL